MLGQHGRQQHDLVFEDGELKLQTTGKEFGNNIYDIADPLMDRLENL